MSDVKVLTVGGYSEVGRNMTAVVVDSEAVILDMGLYLPVIVDFEEEGGHRTTLSDKQMIQMGAIPDDNALRNLNVQVKAIALSHCHLDHIGATPWLAKHYGCPIYGTPFTMEVLQNMLYSDKMQLPNPMKRVMSGAVIKISEKISIEFIHVTHSTPQTAIIAVHTPKGAVLYTNDFKLDPHPVIGKTSDTERLREIGKEGVLGVVLDSLYSGSAMKTPSEKVAREMLKDVMLGTENSDNPMIVTCFASHIARLKSIIDFGKKQNRKIVAFGRSLQKYITAAERVGVADYSKHMEILAYSDKIHRKMSRICKEGASDYLIVCTGSQGEPRSVLSKMLNKQYPFDFGSNDTVIFSNRVIPTEPNISNRKLMEQNLQKNGVRIYRDIHVSGHAAREDIRDLLLMTNPQHVIPSHGHHPHQTPACELAKEMGFKTQGVHLSKNGNVINL